MTAYFYTYNIIFDAPVSGNAKLVYAYLCKCADTDGKSYPSHKAIGAGAGIGVTTVKKALAELENAGLVSIQGQARPDRGRRANIYTIIKEGTGFFLSYANVFTPSLTSKARLVFLYFYRLASGRGQAYPSHRTTAKACGLSVAGVRLAIDELEAAGFIIRQAQYRDNGGQRANLYTIITEHSVMDGDGGTKIEKQSKASSQTQEVSKESEDQLDGASTSVAPEEEEPADAPEQNSTNIATDMSANTVPTIIPNDSAPKTDRIRSGIRFACYFILYVLMLFTHLCSELSSVINPCMKNTVGIHLKRLTRSGAVFTAFNKFISSYRNPLFIFSNRDSLYIAPSHAMTRLSEL